MPSLRGARLAREIWKDPAFADELERQAKDLKRRFNRDLWIGEGQYFALALDADGVQVDALSSNNGHLLWSGIVEGEGRSRATRLFSGWGVRTLAEGEGRYKPIGYYVGTVWPFDNSFIAWALRRYGFKKEAAQVAAGSSSSTDEGASNRSWARGQVRGPRATSPGRPGPRNVGRARAMSEVRQPESSRPARLAG